MAMTMNLIRPQVADVLDKATPLAKTSNPIPINVTLTRKKRPMNARAPAEKLKDVVRLQFDVRRAQLNIIDNLVDICGLSSKKELFSNSMALMKWAVQETQKGRRIASYDPKNDEIEMVALPALDLVDQSHLKDTAVATSREFIQATPNDHRSTVSKPKLGLV